MPENLSLNEIEKNFPLSKRIIFKWIKQGRLNTKKENGETIIKLKDINRLLEER
ncbi:MAG: hypothetical protein ACQESN_11965 [Thermotogota bacterium]